MVTADHTYILIDDCACDSLFSCNRVVVGTFLTFKGVLGGLEITAVVPPFYWLVLVEETFAEI
jgi:hypothetical protein